MRYLAAIACLCIAGLSAHAKGPVRQWIADHRPGIIIKKPQPHVVTVTPVAWYAPPCPNGQCPR